MSSYSFQRKKDKISIKLVAGTRRELDRKKQIKLDEGYTVVNEGVIHMYYSSKYYAIVEKSRI